MRILLVETHLLVCESIKYYLQELDPRIRVTISTSLREAMELAPESRDFDVIILPDRVSSASRQNCYDNLARAFLETPIVILAQMVNRAEALSLIKAGAAGVIPNHLDAEAFILILKLVISGHQYIPSALLESLTIGEPPMPEYGALGDLTPRQREILKLLVQGLPNKAIAKALSIQEITVKAQLTKIFRAFGASNRTELVSIVMGRDKMA